MNATRARFSTDNKTLMVFLSDQEMATFDIEGLNESNIQEFLKNVWQKKLEYLQG